MLDDQGGDDESRLRPPRLYSETLPPEVFLTPAVASLVADPSAAEPPPPGIAPWDDRELVLSPVEPTEEALLEALYARDLEPAAPRPAAATGVDQGVDRILASMDKAARAAPGTGLLLRLPLALRPPPGRRHGMPGDAAGDAAREAYVREIAPWLTAAWRLRRLLGATGRMIPSVPSGTGRWETAVAYAADACVAEKQIIMQLMHAGQALGDVSLERLFEMLPYAVAYRRHSQEEQGNQVVRSPRNTNLPMRPRAWGASSGKPAGGGKVGDEKGPGKGFGSKVGSSGGGGFGGGRSDKKRKR